jgi:ABC-type uncharacterized transport system involved in gliding motility auxiliary subunit
MKTSNQKKPWKYLFLLGPFLLTAGLTAGLISGKWGITPLILLIPGIIIIILWFIWQSKQNQWWDQRSTQAGTNAIIATIAVITILGTINFLGTRYHFRNDLTETKLFSLAPQSRELVRSLQKNIKVWIFDINQNPLDRNLLENYQRQNPKFQFEYVDPQAKPGLVKEFAAKQGEVYLEANNKRQLVQVVNERDRLSEISLTNRLQQITSANPTKVYFLQGHGEHQISGNEDSISQAIKALNDKSFTTEPLNLVEKNTIPTDSKVLVIAGAKRALLNTEVQALQDYLNGGGNILLMIDPDTEPKLEPLLNQWGVKLDNRLAVDIAGNEAFGPAVPIITEYGKHPITKDFGNGISFYRLARPVDTIPTPGIEATPLLITKPYPNTWAESDQKSEKLEYNEGKDRKGPLTLGVALSRKAETPIPQPTSTPIPTPTVSPKVTPTPSSSPSSTITPKPTPSPTPTPKILKTTAESRLVVIGNSDFATNDPFPLQLNGDVFLNSVTWLSQQDQQPLSIRPKEAKNRRINLSIAQISLLRWTSLLLLPLIGFLASGLIWWQRR